MDSLAFLANSLTVIGSILGLIIIQRWMKRNPKMRLYAVPEIGMLVNLIAYGIFLGLWQLGWLEVPLWALALWSSVARLQIVMLVISYYFTVRR